MRTKQIDALTNHLGQEIRVGDFICWPISRSSSHVTYNYGKVATITQHEDGHGSATISGPARRWNSKTGAFETKIVKTNCRRTDLLMKITPAEAHQAFAKNH